MFQVLHKYYRLGSVLSASLSSGVDGLVKDHAYSILRVEQVDGFQLIELRNPWGRGEWQGNWSATSNLWENHPEAKRAVGFEPIDNGAFWMDWDDFARNWGQVGIIDRTVDVHTLKLEVENEGACGPTTACCKGCCRFWCLCQGIRRLYCPHRSSEMTVEVKRRNCCCV